MTQQAEEAPLPAPTALQGWLRVVRRFLWLPALILFGYVFVLNFWVGDDAYIIFRTVDNFSNGYGLRWNVAERVQTFTAPLWTLLVAGFHAVTGEFYYMVLGLSLVLCAATLAIARRGLRTEDAFPLFVLLLASSRAFVDYSSSGLETPLSYLLAILFYREFLGERAERLTARDVFLFCLLAALAFTTRPDTALLYVLPMVHILARGVREVRRGLVPALLLGAVPAAAWELFSLLYYGFPWPNSYYAKLDLGIPVSVLLRQGGRYLVNSFAFDPVTLAVVAVAVLGAAISRRPRGLLAAASAVLYALYAVWIGGDFMIGRFFALPFLISAFVLATSAMPKWTPLLGGALIVYNIILPLVPLKTDPPNTFSHPYAMVDNMYDEAGGYRRGTSLMLYAPFSADRPALTFPKNPQYAGWARWGAGLKESRLRVGLPLFGGVGFIGYFAGPGPYIIDAFAVTDPLLARLPVPAEAKVNYKPGHVLRTIPAGYVESALSGRNEIVDRELSAYYAKLLLVTRASLWSAERLRCIVELNAGSGRKFPREPEPAAVLPPRFLSWR